MDANGGIARAQILADTHHSAACADAGYKRVHGEPAALELLGQLGTSSRSVSVDVCVIRELTRQKNVRISGRSLFSESDCAEEATLRVANRDHLGAKAGDER